MRRNLTSLLLVLVLVLTSQSMAAARGASTATGQMVICTGAGTLAVYVDAQGQPTVAPHICPDATLNVLVDVAAPGFAAPQRLVGFAPDEWEAARPAPRHPRAVPPSRGPPLPV